MRKNEGSQDRAEIVLNPLPYRHGKDNVFCKLFYFVLRFG